MEWVTVPKHLYCVVDHFRFYEEQVAKVENKIKRLEEELVEQKELLVKYESHAASQKADIVRFFSGMQDATQAAIIDEFDLEDLFEDKP